MRYKTCFFGLVGGILSMWFIQLSFSIVSLRYHWKHNSSVPQTIIRTTVIDPTDTKSAILYGNQSNIVTKWRPRKPTDLLMTVTFYGRMGNWMFEYASLLGVASRNGRRPFVPPSTTLLKYFDFSFVESHDASKTKFVQLTEKCYACYDSRMNKLPKSNVTLTKYLQSWKYFKDVQDLVRKEFSFKIGIRKMADEKFKQYIPNKTKPIIAVHVRRTDMATKPENRMGYVAAPLSYIQKAMTYMKSRFGNVTFLVASDDVKWCRENFASNRDVIVIERGDVAVDLATMALCDHMIMTVGTYGWWMAWLVNGHTAYYKDYPKPGKVIARGFKREDHFLPDWIPLGS